MDAASSSRGSGIDLREGSKKRRFIFGDQYSARRTFSLEPRHFGTAALATEVCAVRGFRLTERSQAGFAVVEGDLVLEPRSIEAWINAYLGKRQRLADLRIVKVHPAARQIKY